MLTICCKNENARIEYPQYRLVSIGRVKSRVKIEGLTRATRYRIQWKYCQLSRKEQDKDGQRQDRTGGACRQAG